MTERTEIAKRLGISNNTLKRIAHYGKIEYKMIDGKQCFDFNEIVKAIKENVDKSHKA